MADRGGSVGSGGVASATEFNQSRRERQRQLALETIDLSKDPYFLLNHVGTYECRLCLTRHNTEGNYLAHTQGKRHQQNLAKRAARDAGERGEFPSGPAAAAAVQAEAAQKAARLGNIRAPRIGRPGYRVLKQVDPETEQKGLYFQLQFPDIADDTEPAHRFVSAYAQRREPPDPNFQYVLFAAEPYETVAFKIPNLPLIRDENDPRGPYVHWDADAKQFDLQITFQEENRRS
jgi:splicing factor 3A subunit 2